MSTAHTKGRLIVKGRYSVCTEDGETEVANTRWTTLDSSNDEDNARRLVACWNACEGIPVETLEAVGTDRQFWPIDMKGSSRKGLTALLGIQNFTVQELKRQTESDTRAKLKAQRDELLEAVHRLLCNNDSANKEFARAAIAKAEGGEA